MFVNSVVTFPERGSSVICRTVIFRSGEVQVSDVTVMSRSLPAAPAGIVVVVRTPVT